jgi:hypothetical protein
MDAADPNYHHGKSSLKKRSAAKLVQELLEFGRRAASLPKWICVDYCKTADLVSNRAATMS